jgi:hypothetical protein
MSATIGAITRFEGPLMKTHSACITTTAELAEFEQAACRPLYDLGACRARHRGDRIWTSPNRAVK